MNRFTVFTPTYNRRGTLSRAYESLLNQTYKDFEWLIVDDGSTDNTKELVDTWLLNRKLNIRYVFKKNGGKYSCEIVALNICSSKYLITLDSDDTFLPETIELFDRNWKNIEENNKEDVIAEIRANCMLPDGKLAGNYKMEANLEYIDSSWHTMVLKNRNYNEHLACWNVTKLRGVMLATEKFWHAEKVKLLHQHIWWARLGRAFQTRYINKCARIYFTDADNSWLRAPKKPEFMYNELVGHTIFLDENVQYFFWNPAFFFNLFLKMNIGVIALKISPLELRKQLHSKRMLLTTALFYPLGMLGFFYYKFYRKRFWF